MVDISCQLNFFNLSYNSAHGMGHRLGQYHFGGNVFYFLRDVSGALGNSKIYG